VKIPPYRQLEIRWVDLEPTKGAETRKVRPCVVIQSDLVNRGSKTIIVVPILPGHKSWPFAVNIISSRKNGLDKDRHINLKQLRVVDISRIKGQQGIIEKEYLSEIKERIRLVFGL